MPGGDRPHRPRRHHRAPHRKRSRRRWSQLGRL